MEKSKLVSSNAPLIPGLLIELQQIKNAAKQQTGRTLPMSEQLVTLRWS